MRWISKSQFMAVRLSLVVMLLTVGMCWDGGAVRSFSGGWDATIAVEPPTGTWFVETDVTVEFEYADWTTAVRTLFTDGEWKSQEFDVEGRIGELDISSDVRLEPYLRRFRDWITDFEWELDELAFTLTAKFTRTTDWLIFELEREGDQVEIGTSFRLRAPTGGCALLFYDADLDIAFDWCGIKTDLEFAFDDDGFDEFVVTFSDLASARIPWLTFDLQITRTPEQATIKLSPGVVLESSWCAATFDLELEGDFPGKPNLLPIAIREFSLSWEIEDWEMVANAILDQAVLGGAASWLELGAEGVFDLSPCGEVELDLSLLWTESELGRARFLLTYEPGCLFVIAIGWDIDLAIGRLDRLALDVQVEW